MCQLSSGSFLPPEARQQAMQLLRHPVCAALLSQRSLWNVGGGVTALVAAAPELAGSLPQKERRGFLTRTVFPEPRVWPPSPMLCWICRVPRLVSIT